MKIIKRSGQEVIFDKEKIVAAVRKANREIEEQHRISEMEIVAIAGAVEAQCEKMHRSAEVEEVGEFVDILKGSNTA